MVPGLANITADPRSRLWLVLGAETAYFNVLESMERCAAVRMQCGRRLFTFSHAKAGVRSGSYISHYVCVCVFPERSEKRDGGERGRRG